MTKNKSGFFYKIKQTTEDEYNLAITFVISNVMFKRIVGAVANKTGQNLPNELNSFKILPEHKSKVFPILKANFLYIMDKVKKEINQKHKIALLSDRFEDIIFNRETNDTWTINVIMSGVMSR